MPQVDRALPQDICSCCLAELQYRTAPVMSCSCRCWLCYRALWRQLPHDSLRWCDSRSMGRLGRQQVAPVNRMANIVGGKQCLKPVTTQTCLEVLVIHLLCCAGCSSTPFHWTGCLCSQLVPAWLTSLAQSCLGTIRAGAVQQVHQPMLQAITETGNRNPRRKLSSPKLTPVLSLKPSLSARLCRHARPLILQPC